MNLDTLISVGEYSASRGVKKAVFVKMALVPRLI